MTYILIVYNKKGKEVFRKEYKGVIRAFYDGHLSRLCSSRW
jgi:hypothetical protein